jgi:hypothetical protein
MGAGDILGSICGTVHTTVQGEKYIEVAYASMGGSPRPLDCLGMNMRFANTALAKGLLVKLTGKVTALGADYFVIYDGYVTKYGVPITMKVYCGTLQKPAVDDTVRVRGIISVDDGKAILYMRNEQVDVTSGSAAIQPLPFQGPIKALRDYLLIGTFDGSGEPDQAARLATDYISRASGGTLTEANIRPSLGDAVGSKNWFRYNGSGGFDGWADAPDLMGIFGYTEKCAIYAHVYVWSPSVTTVDIPIGTDDGGKVWVNGVQRFEINAERGVAPGQNYIEDVPLLAGLNSVLIKIVQDTGGCSFITQFAIPDTYIGEGWDNSDPKEGLGYLLNNQ